MLPFGGSRLGLPCAGSRPAQLGLPGSSAGKGRQRCLLLLPGSPGLSSPCLFGNGVMWRFSGIRQPWGSAHRGSHLRCRHLRKETGHQGGPLEGLSLRQVASEDATWLLHAPEGVHTPEALGFKKVHAAHNRIFGGGASGPRALIISNGPSTQVGPAGLGVIVGPLCMGRKGELGSPPPRLVGQAAELPGAGPPGAPGGSGDYPDGDKCAARAAGRFNRRQAGGCRPEGNRPQADAQSHGRNVGQHLKLAAQDRLACMLSLYLTDQPGGHACPT